MLRFETWDGDDVAANWSRFEAPLVDAYVTIFNRDWKESWTPFTARQRLRSSLRLTSNRHPVVTLAWDGDRIAAFALGSVVRSAAGIDDRDLPAYYPLRPHQLGEARRALVPASQEPFVLGSGWAVRPEYRDLMTVGVSTVDFFKRCRRLGCRVVRGWTSRRSRAYFLYLAAGAEVVYDFEDEAQLCLFSAPIGRLLLLSKCRHLAGLGVALIKAYVFVALTLRGALAEQSSVRAGLSPATATRS